MYCASAGILFMTGWPKSVGNTTDNNSLQSRMILCATFFFKAW